MINMSCLAKCSKEWKLSRQSKLLEVKVVKRAKRSLLLIAEKSNSAKMVFAFLTSKQ